MAVYGGCNLLAELVPYRLQPQMQWERAIPFRPEWAAVYLSLDVLLLVAFLRLEETRLRRFVRALVVQTLVAGVCFLVLPMQPMAQGEGDRLFQLADAVNLKNNYFPSLHVSYAFTAALFSPGFWPWALAVTASTLLLHQHYVADLLGAALLAAWAVRRNGGH